MWGSHVCPDFGFCSARLQAGMFLIQGCPAEGGRYESLKI
jgi:hypothetical protein